MGKKKNAKTDDEKNVIDKKNEGKVTTKSTKLKEISQKTSQTTTNNSCNIKMLLKYGCVSLLVLLLGVVVQQGLFLSMYETSSTPLRSDETTTHPSTTTLLTSTTTTKQSTTTYKTTTTTIQTTTPIQTTTTKQSYGEENDEVTKLSNEGEDKDYDGDGYDNDDKNDKNYDDDDDNADKEGDDGELSGKFYSPEDKDSEIVFEKNIKDDDNDDDGDNNDDDGNVVSYANDDNSSDKDGGSDKKYVGDDDGVSAGDDDFGSDNDGSDNDGGDGDDKKEESLMDETERRLKLRLRKVHRILLKDSQAALSHFESVLLEKKGDQIALYGKMRALSQVARKEDSGYSSGSGSGGSGSGGSGGGDVGGRMRDDAIDVCFQALSQPPITASFTFTLTRECLYVMAQQKNQDVELWEELLLGLLEMFPQHVDLYRRLCVQLIKKHHFEISKKALILFLDRQPRDRVAKLYLGVVMKELGDLNGAVDMMLPQLHIITNDDDDDDDDDKDGKHDDDRKHDDDDGKQDDDVLSDVSLYLQLADALMVLQRKLEAKHVYSVLLERGLLQSEWQHHSHNIEGLINKVWWTDEDLSHENQVGVEKLQKKWMDVVKEVRDVVEDGDNASFLQDVHRQLHVQDGNIKVLPLYSYSLENTTTCPLLPLTCQLIQQIPGSQHCSQCQTSILLMTDATLMNSYTATTNSIINIFIPLSLHHRDKLIVRGERRYWKDAPLYFDPSFDLQISTWHEGAELEADEKMWEEGIKDETGKVPAGITPSLKDNLRAVLSIQIWHPHINESQKKQLGKVKTW